MRSLTFFLLSAACGLAGCSTSRIMLRSNRADSVRIDRQVAIRTRIEHIPVIVHVPDQRASAVIEPSDTSHLETEYAASDAFIRSDGKLYHNLRNKPQQKSQNISLQVTDTSTMQTIDRQEHERIEVPVSMPLTVWQRFWLASGKVGWGMLVGACVAFIIRKKA